MTWEIFKNSKIRIDKSGHPADYFDVMKKITKETKLYIYKNLLNKIEKEIPKNFREDFTATLEFFQHTRDASLFLRPTTFWLSYLASGGEDENYRHFLSAMALVEIYNSSTYIFNCALDEKKGYESKEKMKEAIITGNIYRELAERAIDILENNEIHADKIKILRKRISMINEHMYRGQYFDLKVLTIDQYEAGKFQSEKIFFEALGERNEGFSGKFYSFVPELGGILSGKYANELASFGKIYGHCLQLANDLGDCFCPTNVIGSKEKPYKDTLSDLRNNRLTLPIYLALSNPLVDKDLLYSMRNAHNEKKSTKDIYETASKISIHLVELGVFDKVKNILKKEVKKMFKILESLPKSPARDLMKGSVESSLLRNKWFKEANALNRNK